MNFNFFTSRMIMWAIGLVLTSACSTNSETKEIILPDYWIVLDADKATASDGGLSWDFELNHPGKYDVQIVTNGERATSLPEVNLECGEILLSETPRNILVLDEFGEKRTVFQFNRSFQLNETGPQTLKIKIDEPIDQVRILPHYRHKLGFGSGKYYDQWLAMHESQEKQDALAWLREAKYGMFIHWGLYSQAGGIWKGVRMEDSGIPGPGVSEWLMFKFQIPRNEYAELAKSFNPDKSFAQNIAKLAKEAGMKYIVITSKHHDGFALFDSECSEYDMVDATPYKADAINELYEACIAEGLEFGVYYSHGNDWYNGTDGNYANVKKVNDSLGILSHAPGKNLWDPSPNTHAEYIENKALPQIKELLGAMPKLRLIWFDGDGYITEKQAFKFYKTIFDINPNVIVNRRVGYDFGDYLDAGDNVIPSADDHLAKHWETCGTTNNSWAYKSYDDDWKSTQEMLYYLVDIASKGGNYLLNIGPDGLGHVPEASANGLREIGDWLKVNGDAIYGTTRWKTPHEGQDETLLAGTGHRAKKGFSRSFTNKDFWFTARENKVYAICLAEPEEAVHILSLNKTAGVVSNVSLLGSEQEISWEQTDSGLFINLKDMSKGSIGYAVEVTFDQ